MNKQWGGVFFASCPPPPHVLKDMGGDKKKHDAFPAPPWGLYDLGGGRKSHEATKGGVHDNNSMSCGHTLKLLESFGIFD
jgi:hypothetical protein